MGSLTGKVIIVTGASRGIGAAASVALAKAGATVMLVARNGRLADDVAQGIVASGGRASAASCDVTDYAAVEAVVSETEGRFGRARIARPTHWYKTVIFCPGSLIYVVFGGAIRLPFVI